MIIEPQPQLEQRVIGGIDAVKARNGVKDNPPMGFVVGSFGRQRDRAETYGRAISGPMDGRIIHDVTIECGLYVDIELDGSCGDAASQLFQQIISVLGFCGCIVEMRDACLRHNAIPAVTREPLLVDEPEGRHAEIRLLRKARRAWLRRLYKGERSRVRSQKCRGIAGCQAEEIEKFLASSGGKAICRVAYDVGVNMLVQMKTDRESVGIRIRRIVGNGRKAGSVREPHGCRSLTALDVRRAS